MYQIIIKAVNNNTNDVIYEGVKKEYETYWQAARALKRVAQHPCDAFHKTCTSYRIPENYIEDIHAYACWNYRSSIRTTLYIKRVEKIDKVINF